MESMQFKPTVARFLLFSFSAATVAFFPVWLSIFEQRGTPLDPQFLRNHQQLPYFDRLDYVAGGVALAALTAALFASLLLARRFAPGATRYLVMLITAGLFLHALNVLRTHYLPWASWAALRDGFAGSPVLAALALVAGIAVAGLAVVRLQRPLTALVFLGAPAGIVVLMNVAGSIFAFGRESVVAQPAPLAPMLSAPARQPRVVWIIFDELDYRLAFEDRPSGLNLPHFDRLRSSGLFATNATPPANSTFPSVPALTTGRWLDSAAFDPVDGAVVRLRGNERSQKWESLPGIFSEARRLGINSGVLGQQYIPYCRVFHRDVSSCWEWGGAWQAQPRNALRHTAHFAGRLLSYVPVVNRRLFPGDFDSGLFYLEFGNALDAAVVDPRLSLVFAHWMLPHTPYVYDRRTGTFTQPNERTQAYFDNIALADRFLGETVAALVGAGALAQRTTVIVSSDHSWKRSRRYDGRSDPRVPFLVWRPDSRAGVTYSAQFNTIVTKDLVLALIGGALENYADIALFIGRTKGGP